MSGNLIFGSVIHSVLADFNQERLIGGQVTLDELLTVFAVSWEDAAKDNPKIEYSKGKDYPTLLMEGKKLLEVFSMYRTKNNLHNMNCWLTWDF